MAAGGAAGRRVFIRPPTARDRDELLALNSSSRDSLRPWIEPMVSRAAFRIYRRRARLPSERRFVVCRRENGVIVGVINLSQVFRREGFSRRYLKIFGRWRDHERWALMAEDRRW